MNYQKIYNQIIERSKGRLLNTYTEKHHIIPKCMGGSNHTNNIAVLTIKEHRVAHACLHLIHPDHSGLALAYVKMFYGNRWQFRDKSVPLKLYEKARIIAYEVCKQKRLGKTYEDIMGPEKAAIKKANQSLQMTGRTHSEESKTKLRKPKPIGFGEKISKALTGRVFKESTLEKMKKRCRKIEQIDLKGEVIKVWDSGKDISKALGLSNGNLPKACREGRILKGYRWRYQN